MAQKESRCQRTSTWIKSFDIYGTTVNFNINGSPQIKTWFGTVFSLLTYMALIAYAYIRS